MSTKGRHRRAADAVALDLAALDRSIGRLLPGLLLGRFDPDILHRWARVRAWVSSADEGDWVMDLPTMSIAVDYLTCVVQDQAPPCTGPHTDGPL